MIMLLTSLSAAFYSIEGTEVNRHYIFPDNANNYFLEDYYIKNNFKHICFKIIFRFRL